MTGIVVFGVSGSGKTTIGRLLATRLAWRFVDGDDLHPPGNVAKMRAGIPLTDADRRPWLAKVAAVLDQPGDAVVACSALRRAYRELLRTGRSVRLVYLKADRTLIEQRLARRTGHFFPPALLASQFATLEEPAAEEGALTVNVAAPPAAVVDQVVRWLTATAPSN